MIIVLRIANPYIILRQISNLPQLRTSAATGGLGALSAGVGVHLSVDDDDVDVLVAGQDVVEAAESDIITPTVTAEDPLALLDEAVV